MSNCPFCNLEPAPDPGAGKRLAGLLRNVQWLFPATLLVLMPKCPLCVAAYIALFTGVGVSVSTARWIQILMLMFCLGSLGYVVVKSCRRRTKVHGYPASSSS
jgi:hypothetical protein